jgi:hypothetical protein
MQIFLLFSDELTPVSDTSNTVSVTSELCLKPSVNAIGVRVFVQE